MPSCASKKISLSPDFGGEGRVRGHETVILIGAPRNFQAEFFYGLMKLHVRKIRVVGDFPEKTIKICEVTRGAAPVCAVRRLHDLAPKAATCASKASTSAGERTLWASEKPGNPEP